MTTQLPDHLENNHPSVEFGELALYGVIVGDITANYGWGAPYPFQNRPSIPSEGRSSALWRGYVAEFVLSHEGTITLVAFHYTVASEKLHVQANEQLKGDFWLVMKSNFDGNRVYVPFESNVIVADEKRWVIENGDALEVLKHPPKLQRFKPQNITLESPMFIGFIEEIAYDKNLENYLWIVLNQEIPRANYYCKVHVVRDEKVIARTEICGSSGGGAGPWMLKPPFDIALQIGDSVFAEERLPNNAEVESQKQAIQHN